MNPADVSLERTRDGGLLFSIDRPDGTRATDFLSARDIAEARAAGLVPFLLRDIADYLTEDATTELTP